MPAQVAMNQSCSFHGSVVRRRDGSRRRPRDGVLPVPQPSFQSAPQTPDYQGLRRRRPRVHATAAPCERGPGIIEDRKASWTPRLHVPGGRFYSGIITRLGERIEKEAPMAKRSRSSIQLGRAAMTFSCNPGQGSMAGTILPANAFQHAKWDVVVGEEVGNTQAILTTSGRRRCGTADFRAQRSIAGTKPLTSPRIAAKRSHLIR